MTQQLICAFALGLPNLFNRGFMKYILIATFLFLSNCALKVEVQPVEDTKEFVTRPEVQAVLSQIEAVLKQHDEALKAK